MTGCVPAVTEKQPLLQLATESARKRLVVPAGSEALQVIAVETNTGLKGPKHPSAKPWKGEGPGILEIVKEHDGDTYRALYTVRFTNAVYVLHAFQKKLPHGIATRQSDVALVKERLKLAEQDYEERYG